MLREAVHPVRIARLIGHAWPGACKTLIGHTPQQQRVNSKELSMLELGNLVIPVGNDHLFGASMTPSSVINWDTITFLIQYSSSWHCEHMYHSSGEGACLEQKRHLLGFGLPNDLNWRLLH